MHSKKDLSFTALREMLSRRFLEIADLRQETKVKHAVPVLGDFIKEASKAFGFSVTKVDVDENSTDCSKSLSRGGAGSIYPHLRFLILIFIRLPL